MNRHTRTYNLDYIGDIIIRRPSTSYIVTCDSDFADSPLLCYHYTIGETLETGIEPVTLRLTVARSNQLSYSSKTNTERLERV